MQLEKIKAIYPSFLLVLCLMAGSVYTAYLIADRDVLLGPVVIITLLSLLAFGFVLKDYKVGLYLMLILGTFMSFINRMSGFPVQFGIVLDIMAGLTFLVMLITDRFRDKRDWSGLRGGITWLYIIIVVYQLLQVFNPNAVSFLGWVVAFRANTSFLLFLVFFHLFVSVDELKRFTVLWMVLASLVGLYGIWQEWVGLNAKELEWIYSSETRVDLLLIWGHMRKFSLLSDPSAFGLFMAHGGLACFVLALGPFSGGLRLLLGALSAMMFVSMSYSGTRTAIAMVVVGLAFYIVLTLRSRKTFLVLVVAGVGGLAMLFGPFYGSTMNRIRSTFNMSEDASMNVRDRKRIALQSYVQEHPFGGGLNTTGMNGVKYSAGHPLAEGWDPDSGYLLTALELGWIGLILGLLFFGSVVMKGIDNYYRLKDPVLKTLNLAYIVPFMALSVAHFTQDAMFQKPIYLLVTATYAVMLALPVIEERKFK